MSRRPQPTQRPGRRIDPDLAATLTALLDGACSVLIGGLRVRSVQMPNWMAANDSGKKEPFFYLEETAGICADAVKGAVKAVKNISAVSARTPHP